MEWITEEVEWISWNDSLFISKRHISSININRDACVGEIYMDNGKIHKLSGIKEINDFLHIMFGKNYY